jgi:hypothetical protein
VKVAANMGPALVSMASLLAWSGAAVGQGVPVALLPPLGSEVRAEYLLLDERTWVDGPLLEGTERGITVATREGVRREIPADVLLGLEVSRGRSRGRGLVRGAAAGGAGAALILGAAFAALAYDEEPSCILACTRSEAFTVGAAIGLIIGLPTGAFFGLVIAPTRWERAW